MFSGSSRTEEAAELYTKAGNTFKMAKKWAGKLCIVISDHITCSEIVICGLAWRSVFFIKEIPCFFHAQKNTFMLCVFTFQSLILNGIALFWYEVDTCGSFTRGVCLLDMTLAHPPDQSWKL